MNRENLSTVPLVGPMAQNLALDDIAPAKGVGASDVPLLASAHPLHGIKTELQVCVGHAQVTVGELLNATAQPVVVLDRTPEQPVDLQQQQQPGVPSPPVDLLLNGQVVARGQLVAVDGHFAVRITELPLPLALASKA